MGVRWLRLVMHRIGFLRTRLVHSETVLVIALERSWMRESIFDHERIDVYRLAIE